MITKQFMKIDSFVILHVTQVYDNVSGEKLNKFLWILMIARNDSVEFLMD